MFLFWLIVKRYKYEFLAKVEGKKIRTSDGLNWSFMERWL